MITDRKLDGYLGPFNSAKGREKDMWEKQSWTHDRIDTSIQETINTYKNIGPVDPIYHDDRINHDHETKFLLLNVQVTYK